MTNAANLGSAYGKITLDPSGVSTAMDQARQSFADGIKGIGNQAADLGAAFTTLSAPILAFGATGVRVAAEFETVMKQIELFGDVTGDELERVRGFVLQMGADTIFSAQDAGNAMLELLKTGQSLEEAMTTLPVVLQLATVGELSLASATSIVTTALAQFGLKAGDAGRVSEALARAANASRADVGSLGLALSNVGPIAARFGLSIEDTSAVLAVFSNNGIDGAEAGTQLKSMLLNLSRPTDEVQGAFKKLGVNLYDGAGNVRDFNTVIVDLDAALDKLPVQEQNELMQTLAGNYGITGLAALRASGGIDAMKEAMEKQKSAAELADGASVTFNRNLESLGGSIETLQATVLRQFVEVDLKNLVVQAREIVNAITGWASANPELANTIVRVLAAVSALGPTLFIAGKALAAIGSIIGVVLSPVGLLVAAIIALKVAWDNNLLGIQEIAQQAFQSISNFVQDRVLPIVESFIAFLGNLWSMAGPALKQLSDWFSGVLLPAIGDTLQNYVLPALGSFVDFLGEMWEAVRPSLEALAAWFFEDALPMAMDFITGTVIPIINTLIAAIGGIWEIVGPLLAPVVAWFASLLPTAFSFITDTLIPVLAGIWNAVSGGLTTLGDWFTVSVWPTIQTAVSDFVTNVWTPLSDKLSGIWNLVSGALGELATWFTNSGWPGIQSAVSDFITNVWTPLSDKLSGIWNLVSGALGELATWFTNSGWPGIQSAVSDFVTNVWTPLVTAFTNLWDNVQGPLNNLRAWFETEAWPIISEAINVFVTGVWNDLITGMSNAWTTVSGALTSLAAWFQTTGLPLIQSAIDTFYNSFLYPWVIDPLYQLWTWVSGGLASLAGWFQTDGLPAIQTAVDAFYNNFLKPFVIDPLLTIWTTISPGMSELLKWFETDGWPKIKTAIDGLWNGVLKPLIEALKKFWDDVSPALQSFYNWVSNNIGKVIDFVRPVLDIFTSLVDKVREFLGVHDQALQAIDMTKGATGAGAEAYRRALGGVTGRDSGGSIFEGMTYKVGPSAMPEAFFIAPADGMAVPNVDKVMKTYAHQALNERIGDRGTENSSGVSVSIASLVIHAESEEGGRAAARGFGEQLRLELEALG